VFLYGVTLQTSAAMHCVAYGNFSGAKAQEIVASKGHTLELLRYIPHSHDTHDTQHNTTQHNKKKRKKSVFCPFFPLYLLSSHIFFFQSR
jgi:hypothetical protein